MQSRSHTRRWVRRRNRRDAINVLGWLLLAGLCVSIYVLVAAGWGTP